MGEKVKPEDRAMVTTSDLTKMKEEMRQQLLETEIAPLKEKLNTALEAVQLKAVVKPDFVAPTKEQIMHWIAPDCKDEKILTLFIATCQHLQLDPIKKEIYLYEHSGTWIIKVDYKVPVAVAQRDTDYLHFKSQVEYLAEKVSDKLNPQSIKGAWCRLYKRSWVKLAAAVGNPELAYKEHFAPWETWRRVKKDGNLFSTWAEKGHFYIEKTAIDHCFRLVYSELCGGLPPSIGYDVIKEEQQTVEATLLKNHTKKESAKALGAGKIDRGFSEAPGEEQTQEPKNEQQRQIAYKKFSTFMGATFPNATGQDKIAKLHLCERLFGTTSGKAIEKNFSTEEYEEALIKAKAICSKATNIQLLMEKGADMGKLEYETPTLELGE